MSTRPEIIVEDPFTKVRVLNSGTILIARQVPGALKFKVEACVQSGSLLDKLPGTAHFFEHLPLKRTQNYSDHVLNTQMNNLGGHINAHTTYNSTNFEAEALNQHVKAVVSAAAEMTCYPSVEENNFQHEKGIILTEEAMRDYNGWDEVQRILSVTLGAKAPASIAGAPEDIAVISSNDVRQFNKDNYFSERLIVYGQGDHPPEKVLSLLEQSFILPSGTPAVLPNYVFIPDTKNFPSSKRAAKGSMIFRAFDEGTDMNKVYASVVMTNMLLDYQGPLYQRVRHQQPLTYAVGLTGPMCPGKIQMGGVSFIAFPDRVKTIVEELTSGIIAFCEAPDEKLFERAKQKMLAKMKEDLLRDPYIQPVNMFSYIVDYKRIPERKEVCGIVSRTTLDDVMQVAHNNLFQASLLYEGNIQDNYPDHNTVNSALNALAPHRSVKRQPQSSPPAPATM